MNEQPDPEPQKPQSDAAPKPASAPQGLDASRAQAYVPLPGRPPRKGRGVLVLAALIAAGALAGTAVHFRPPSGPAPIAIAAAQRDKVLTVTDADVSLAATERVRSSEGAAAAAAIGAAGTMGGGPTTMGSGGAPPVQTAPSAPVQQAPAAGAPGAPVENRASSPLPVAPPELVSPAASAPQSVLTPQGRTAVRSDGWSIFSMRLIDDCAEDGDVVQISVDGVPMSYLSLSHAGATLEIPLKKGESHRITVTAVRDGDGGVTLGLQTSAGTILSRNMAVGESDTWTVDYK
ncbi:MAG: hypothetical protein PHS14_01065 [Elusimicrobia bacterium]|nr:hypothetical protein [Elusimicrobiota bacterium]